jgi:ribosomal protein L37AE/L43A
MPKVETDVPEKLRPYKFHGLDMVWDDRVATGDCPWCGREGKFSVSLETGLWKCYVCGEGSEKGGGNVYTFLRKLLEKSIEGTVDYHDLSNDRGIYPDTLVFWELAKSVIDGTWLIPGYNAEGKLCQIYRRVTNAHRSLLMPTPGLGHQMFGRNLVREDSDAIYVCEGPWDGMALWEAMGHCKRVEGGLASTASSSSSLLGEAGVIAVPSCSTFLEGWLPLFDGKRVTLLYDNDHPGVHPRTGKPVPPAGWAGMARAAGLLAGVARSVEVVRWGGPDAPFDASLAPGYDVRDALSPLGPGTLPERLGALLGLVGTIPPDWVKPKKAKARKGGEAMECKACPSYRVLTNSWRKALRWTDGLDRALSCMLACAASTRMIGDQLWLKVISPASSGKTTLAEAVAVAKKYVKAVSTIRGMHSGFREEGGSGEDNSLLSQVYDKTLVIKDGDTLLKSPNLEQVLSEMRDVYDGTSRTSYRNKMSKDYEGIRLTVLLCGTNSLKQIDASELGERFLDCVIMDKIDDEMEDEILERVVHRAARDVAVESNGQAADHYAPELSEAMQLTGGYVTWLREHAADLLSGVEYSPTVRRKLTRLGKFVAHMRARPSVRQEEVAEREFATRLVSQLTRLAGCLALTLNRDSVDEEVMRRVQQVAMDTSRGRTLAIASHLHGLDDGLESKTIALLTGQTEDKTRGLLRFLRAIAVVENHQPVNAKGVRGKVHWRLTDRMRRLYHEVVAPLEGEL